jgi:hypothetical protein
VKLWATSETARDFSEFREETARRVHGLLPWNWQKPAIAHTAAA